MNQLKLPKKPYGGMKVYCNKCKSDNKKCKHYENQRYRIRVHIPGTKKSIKSKVLISNDYDEAIKEAIEFKKFIERNNYQTVVVNEPNKNYSVVGAILKYFQYLSGEHEYVHKRKNVSTGHRNESIRFCKYFAKTLKKNVNIELMRIENVSQKHVADFYLWAENHYNPSTFNKCMGGLKSFFDFLINIEEIEMKNPFETYVSKSVEKSDNETLTKTEFDAILGAIDDFNPIIPSGTKGRNRSMFHPYLKEGFKLFLLTGGRREEVVELKWSDILITINNIRFFKIVNLKVERSNKTKGKNSSLKFKYIPINEDLMNLLNEMGYENKKDSNDYILFPNRVVSANTIKNNLSRSFTHYRKGAGVNKEISLSNLRKTYLSWVNSVMAKDTMVLSSHGSEKVLEKYYLDPTIISAVEKGALEIKIFG